MGTAWIDKASGSYNSTFDATLTAVTNDASAQLVYTTDGSDPTASSTKATSGQTVTIPMGETTLKVGLLIGSTVSGIVTRTYTVKEPETITVHVNTDNVGWTYVNFWSWGGDGSHAPTNASWPGDKITTTKTVGGKNWYYKEFKINSDIDCVNFVFSNGTSANANQNQTVNVENVSKNAFFEISSTKNDGKYLVNDVTDSYTTSVEAVTTQTENTDNRWYNINGQVLNGQPTQKGIYINNGKKVVIK